MPHHIFHVHGSIPIQELDILLLVTQVSVISIFVPQFSIWYTIQYICHTIQFCQRFSQLHKIVTYVSNKWITYVLIISPFSNLWQNDNKKMRYKGSHKSLNSYSLVEYDKIYPNTNSWKFLQEESLW